MTRPQTIQRWVGHADLDAFFASVEQRDQPEYRDRPVVVGALPRHRGVVAAVNCQARAFGIHSDTPDKLDYQRLARVTEGLIGAICLLAEKGV